MSQRMNEAKMYERVLACDASCNGRFFTGVITTGIYCLPSCSARKPKPENIRFFPSCEAAREFGLRPCRKCHPDDFARGADPVLETIESLVAEIRATPQAFPDARAIVKRSGFGTTRVFELFRQHYHTTPADLLLHARLDATKHELIATDAPLLEIAARAGFESQSSFHEHFRQFNGLTPTAYRALAAPGAGSFEITLPENFPLARFLRSWERDASHTSEKLEGDTCIAAVRLNGEPVLLTMQFGKVEATAPVALISVTINSLTKRSGRPLRLEAHALVCGIFGLAQDAPAFARLSKRLGLSRLVAKREGLRISQTHSIFDALIWVIIGQQINLGFTYLLRRRLFYLVGEALGDSGLYASPTPKAVAALEPAQLMPLQFSRQKADYLISTARLITSGALDLEKLRTMSATRAERTLLAIRGLGPWSVNYIMMRALGFADCVPYGDTGVTSGLKTLFKLEIRPDVDATRRLMSVFSPHRSLATAHLWQLLKPEPTSLECGGRGCEATGDTALNNLKFPVISIAASPLRSAAALQKKLTQ